MVIFLMPTAIYVYESDEEKPIVNFNSAKIIDFFVCFKLVFSIMLCNISRNLHSNCGLFDTIYFVGLSQIC